jgi:EpsI family protein
VILPSPETQALLNKIYNQTLTRTYVNASGYRIMLSVAYGGDQSDGTRAHLPERCYPAQGFQISVNVVDQLQLADRMVGVRRLMSKQDRRSEPITYWLLVGDQVTTSRMDQKLAQFKLGLKGLIPDGMLVRVSSIDRDMSHGHLMQAQFLAALANAIPDVDRARIFGNTLM